MEQDDARVPTLALRVNRRERVADGVALVEFVDPDGRELPSWQPGAHLELVLPSGLIRHYSLCGDPAIRTRTRLRCCESTPAAVVRSRSTTAT